VIELDESHVVGPGEAWLYESPLWDHRRQVMLWVDVDAGDVYEHDPSTDVTSRHHVAGTVSCIALRAAGGYVLATRDAVAVVDAALDGVQVVAELPGLPEDARLNDGAVSPDGAFWVGSMTHDRIGAGVLFRVDPDHSFAQVLDGVSISNGMDWAADAGGDHYYADTMTGRVDVLRTGPAPGGWALHSREPWFRTPDGPGLPDGLAVDADGHVWVALWGAGEVVRVSPTGDVVATVRVPARQTSCVAFGGPDLTDMYITTATENLTAEDLAAHPLSGSVFRWRGDVAGRRSREWQG